MIIVSDEQDGNQIVTAFEDNKFQQKFPVGTRVIYGSLLRRNGEHVRPGVYKL